jgi:hypothetical protein
MSNIDELSKEVVFEINHLAGKASSMAETRSIIIMMELFICGRADFLLLRDDRIRKWWGGIIKESEAAAENRKKMWETYLIKSRAYQRLSPDERKALGIKKPIRPKIVYDTMRDDNEDET